MVTKSIYKLGHTTSCGCTWLHVAACNCVQSAIRASCTRVWQRVWACVRAHFLCGCACARMRQQTTTGHQGKQMPALQWGRVSRGTAPHLPWQPSHLQTRLQGLDGHCCCCGGRGRRACLNRAASEEVYAIWPEFFKIYIYMDKYIYIYIFVYIYMYIYMYIYIYIYILVK